MLERNLGQLMSAAGRNYEAVARAETRLDGMMSRGTTQAVLLKGLS